MISIILPCFNVEKYLERCFASCLAQTYQDFELIFVNDSSEDDTLAKIKDFQIRDSRVKLIDLKINLGTFHARKIGYKSSKGDYIFFLDPDDEIAPDFLRTMLEQMTLKSADMVFCKLDVRPKKIYRADVEVPNDCVKQEILKKTIIDIKFIPKGSGGKLYRKSLVNNIYRSLCFVNTRFVYAEDVVFFFAALINSNIISSVKEKLYFYYINTSSITNSRDINKINNNIDQIKMAINFLEMLAADQNECTKKASAVLINSLLLDKKYLERINCILSRNNIDYLYKTLEIIRFEKGLKNFIRLFVFFISLGSVKLR